MCRTNFHGPEGVRATEVRLYILPTYQYNLNICISLQLRPHTLTCSVIEYATHPLRSNKRGCGTGVSHCQEQFFVGTVSVSSLDSHGAMVDSPRLSGVYPVWQHTFVSPSAFSRRAVVSYWRMYVHEVLVNRLGGLSLPRKSVVRLTDRPDMTLDVYCGRKTTMQQQCNGLAYLVL